MDGLLEILVVDVLWESKVDEGEVVWLVDVDVL